MTPREQDPAAPDEAPAVDEERPAVDEQPAVEEASEPTAERAWRRRARATLAPAARVALVGGAVAALVAAAGATSREVSLAASPAASGSTARAVAATDALLTCPGAPLSGTSGVASQSLPSSYLARSAPQRVIEAIVTPNDDAGDIEIAAPGVTRPIATSSTDVARGASPAGGVQVRAKGARAAGLIASQQSVATSETVRGLAVIPCAAPTTESWIVVGGDAPGRQERLVLTNPGENPVQVRLTAYRGDGTRERVGGEDTVIPPNERRNVLLDGLVGTDGVQVVRVQAEGAAVGVSAVDTWLDGVTPRGMAYAAPTAAPSREAVITGVPKGAAMRLVLAAPGEEDAVVTVRALVDGEPRQVNVATVTRGSSATVPIKNTAGARGFLIESDVPVLASLESTVTEAGGDLAWSPATPPITDLAGLATSPSIEGTAVTRTLTIAATGKPATVEVTTVADGEPQTRSVEVPADQAAEVALDQAEGVWVRPVRGDGVHAAVVLSGRGSGGRALAEVVPLVPARAAVQEVELAPVP
ncbi:DUF5719 family protein [Janibacter sp. GXQ6167]|uniref:DUF5719 family protein n=1 Tax=Janibacter sp. GXQ6167 TaxID=3240791 RepID=UPI003525AC7E